MFRWLNILVIALFAVSSKAEQTRLNIYTEDLPPFQLLTTKNDISGINIEILEIILKAEKINYKITMFPWTRAYQTTLSDPQGALISTAMTLERKSLFQWVGPFLSTEKGVYLYKLKSNENVQIKSLVDLNNYSIGVVRADLFERFLLDKGVLKHNLVGFSDNETAHKMLFKGKVDLVIGSPNTMLNSATKYSLDPKDFIKVFAVPASFGNYLAINKSVDPEIVNRLNKRLEKTRAAIDIAEFQIKYKVKMNLHWN